MSARKLILLAMLSLVAMLLAVSTEDGHAQCDLFRTVTGDAADDNLGSQVSGAGDVNADGYPDIIVSAPRSDAGGSEAGQAYVYSGFDGGLLLTFTGEAAGDQLGFPVAGAGDVNGDGYDDVVVGARMNGAAGYNAGRVYLFLGGPGPYPRAVAAASADMIITGEGGGNRLGYAVAGPGDFNHDGYDDLILGAPQDWPSSGQGRAYMFLGSPGPYPKSVGAGVADVIFVGDGVEGRLGYSVSAAGDVNKDGYGDVILGANPTNLMGVLPGAAYVYFGRPRATPYTLLPSDRDLFFRGEAAYDLFGMPVSSAGDVNGDGFGDLLIGARYNDAGGTDAGRAYVFGGPDGRLLHVFDGGSDDWFGTSASGLGDINCDGFDDFVVGAFNAYSIGHSPGRAYVLSGAKWDTLCILTGEAVGDGFGAAVSGIGDADRDGRTDFVVGAPLNDAGGTDAGRAYLYRGAWNCSCDTLRIDPVKLYYGPDGCRAPVNLTNCTPLKGATIPLKYDPLPAGWHFDSVSFVGGRMSDWDFRQATHDAVNRTILINALVNTGGTGKTEEPAGSGPLYYLWFSGPSSNYTCDELVDTVCIDTTTIPGSPSPKKLTLVDNGNPAQGFVPIFERGCLYLHHFQIFDFNCDWVLDVIDLVNMIDYVFSGGVCPSVCQAADGNCDGVADVFDVVDAIDCIFSGGLCPVCCDAAPVPALAKRAPAEAVADIQTASLNGTDWTATLSVQSPAPWRAAQLEWTFDSPVDQMSVTIDEGAAGLKTYWHLDGRQLKVGLIDISGEAQIAAGSRPILRLSGSGDFPGVRLTDGVLVDQNNEGIRMSPVSAAGTVASVPTSYSLDVNRPNPFNAGTVIHYTLGQDGQATVAVFDILGRHVATLVDEFQSAGRHEVAWNGTDAHGQAVASGMYFYRLTAGGFSQSKKMVLLK